MSRFPKQTIAMINGEGCISRVDPLAAILVSEIGGSDQIAIAVMQEQAQRLRHDLQSPDVLHYLARDCVSVNPMALLDVSKPPENGAFGFSYVATRSGISGSRVVFEQMDDSAIDAIRNGLNGDTDEQSLALAHCADDAVNVRALLDMMRAFPLRQEKSQVSALSGYQRSARPAPGDDYTGVVAFNGMGEMVRRLENGGWEAPIGGYLYAPKRSDFQATLEDVHRVLTDTISDGISGRYSLQDVIWEGLTENWLDAITVHDFTGSSVDPNELGKRLEPLVEQILDAVENCVFTEGLPILDAKMKEFGPQIEAIMEEWNAEIRAGLPAAFLPDTSQILVAQPFPDMTPRAIMRNIRDDVRYRLDNISNICASVGIDAKMIPFCRKANEILNAMEFGASLPDVRVLVANTIPEQQALMENGVSVFSSLQSMAQEMPDAFDRRQPVGVYGQNAGLVDFLYIYMPEHTITLAGPKDADTQVRKEAGRPRFIDPQPAIERDASIIHGHGPEM